MRPARALLAMLPLKTLLALTIVTSLARDGAALRCHKCIASNENDCNKQGSHSCPQYADACSTITAPNSVIKSCSYKSFCDQARRSSGGATLHCCFSDDCNGPRGSRSSGAAMMPHLPCLLAVGLAGTLLLGVP
ncbi:uncharacterized protein LOC121107413 [Gallus gallus]|uniref:uncharacterized protein LOC121107413 n=1 Tax=Gallus gallus TaxID=9031 RepID=UPI00035045BF|nr:uncharacterized protein LOC121107413 [Gallus gallus]